MASKKRLDTPEKAQPLNPDDENRSVAGEDTEDEKRRREAEGVIFDENKSL